MPDRAVYLRELALRIAAAKARGDHRSAELHAAIWHKVNAQTDPQREVAGLARRLAARQASIPLDERMSMGKEKNPPEHVTYSTH